MLQLTFELSTSGIEALRSFVATIPPSYKKSHETFDFGGMHSRNAYKSSAPAGDHIIRNTFQLLKNFVVTDSFGIITENNWP